MRYLASPTDRLSTVILDLTGATLAGFAIAHVAIAVRTGFTGFTAISLAILLALLAAVLLLGQRAWVELEPHALIRGRGPLRVRRYLPRSAIYFAGIEHDGRGHHLAICLRGGERLRVGYGFAYADLHAMRAQLRA